jgi:hypothetical protein
MWMNKIYGVQWLIRQKAKKTSCPDEQCWPDGREATTPLLLIFNKLGYFSPDLEQIKHKL